MEEKNININDTNIKLEKLIEKCELLEKVNKDNNQIIMFLNTQLKFLRKEYKQELENLKKDFDNEIQKIKKILQKEKNRNDKDAILMIDKNKVIKNDQKSEKSKDKTEHREKSKEKKEGKNEYKNEFKKEDIKEQEINKINNEQNKNNGYRETTILELFENKLSSIFFDQNPYILSKDINDLKKIAGAIIIKGHGPSTIVSQFLTNNINNFTNELNPGQKNVIENKKKEIFRNLPDSSLLRKIKKIEEVEFIKEFRKKFGITEEDFSVSALKNELIKNDYDGKNVLKAILKKLNYLSANA